MVARFVWGVVRSSTGIHDIPCKVEDFSSWVESFPKKVRQVDAVGAAEVFLSLWKARNAATFRHDYPHDPSVIFYLVSYWMSFWAGLQKKGQLILPAVAAMLVDVANCFFNKRRGWVPMTKRLGVG